MAEDYDIPPMVDALVESVKKAGPMVLEVWDCKKCKAEAFVFHHFSETIQCGVCGHSIASKVPIYKAMLEKRADEA